MLAMRVGSAFLLMLAAVVAAAMPAAAGEGLVYELSVGALSHDVPNLWSGFRRESQSVDINVDAMLSPSMQAFFGTIRPAVGATINTEGLTSIGYADARYRFEGVAGLYFGFGLGAAIHDGNTGREDPTRKALGSRVLFHVPIEVGWHMDEHNSISGYFEHTSNGYTMKYNEGMDRLGVRYGYRF